MQRFLGYIFGLCLLAAGGAAVAEEQRTVLYASGAGEELKAIVARLQDPQQAPLAYDALPAQGRYYARIAPRKHIVAENGVLSDKAILGTKPFVFLTTPEGLYGKSLLDIYLDIGYEAEDIIRWQRDADMVAVLFRYPDAIALPGGPPAQDWRWQVYVPTWDNIFMLFEKLAAEAAVEPARSGEFAPERLFFTSQAQQYFVLSFPEAGKQRVKTAEYATLKNTGGADWVYRDLLEKKLSIFEHFRGNGRTLNELVDPHGVQHEAGLREFAGPNARLADLPEIAVVHLGSLSMNDAYGGGQPK